MQATVRADETNVFPRFLDLAYPNIERGKGVWLETTDGHRILDASSGGAMVACLGHGVTEIAEAAAAQAEKIAYFYNHHFTSRPQEELADRVIEVMPEMARVKFASGGSEANETAVRLARTYHVDRGRRERWRIISPAQAYHGSTLGTLALSGRRRSLQDPYSEYMPAYLHIPPSTPRFDPTGEAALEALDQALKEAGPETVSAFFCEPVSAAALPGYSPPARFWEGLAERREKYGFVVCFDEIVTGMGRVGTWLAAHDLPIEPDIVTIGKGLGAGYTPLAAVVCREHIYDALAEGSAEFDLGHTWDGAPLPCAVGLAVLDYIQRHKLVDRVRERGPELLAQVEAAVKGSDIVGEVRGRGFLLGVSLVDPRDGKSFLPHELDVATLVDDTAFDMGLLISSTHSTPDGYAGDEVLLAPAYTTTEEELQEMVERFNDTISAVEQAVKKKL
ncbi:MAG TPA: aminotransferase class III-fold pyridoxal phosphate-dependent enzyme [Candidatus Dormibacteraeota bacterium]|nr:aminotransferase class III-fold pyridoxal phosphate-dependent enzyme [Candidatus Dormibacteraeota bacterium]